MKRYRLEVLDGRGGAREVELLAPSRAALQQLIAAEGWVVLRQSRKRGAELVLKGEPLILFCQHLQLLLQAGISVHDAMLALAEECESKVLRSVCRQVADEIDKGQSLSQSLRVARVDSFCMAMVKTGEKTGRLSELLGRAAEHLQWREELLKKIRAALAYPALILVMLAILVPLLFVFLVPQLLGFLAGMQSELPWYTELLVDTAHWCGEWGLWVMAAVVFGGLALAVLWLCVARFRAFLDKIKLRLPLLGPLSQQLQMAQFSEQLGIMYAAGIPVVEALPLLADSASNRFFGQQLRTVESELLDGLSLHQGMRKQGFPPMLLRMVLVGELSGNLDQALEHASVLYSRQAHGRADRLAAVIGPAALLLAGAMIIWLIAALILPLYDGIFSMGTGL